MESASVDATDRGSSHSLTGAPRRLARCACALIVFPVAFVIGLLSSLPALVRAEFTLALAVLSLGWTALLLVLHITSVLLHTVGLAHRRKVLLTREGVNRLFHELAADLADLAVVPRSVARHTLRALKRGNALVDRVVKTSRVRSSELLSTLGKRLQPQLLGFEDRYTVIEHLPSGGSTARLYVVREVAGGAPRGDKLVLKHFSLNGGSHLENIVRESAAVKLATRLGIVRDSHMSETSFYYVMPYYEGSTLTREVLALHRSLPDGASPGPVEQVKFIRWLRDLLEVIVAYHERGVFHKDIKPDNLIASGDRLHLIDIGLLTPLESTLQLTTHGTEYFRDPEMVKLAVRGVAIRDVDCPKFDIYSMGAVLYFLLEGEFPSLGSLSQHRKRTPLCLQWIATRAMTDFDKRYSSAREMKADVERLLELAVSQPLATVTVACLPSFRSAEEPRSCPVPVEPTAAAAHPEPMPPISVANPQGRAPRRWSWAGMTAVLLVTGCLLAWRELGFLSTPTATPESRAGRVAYLDDPRHRESISNLLAEVGDPTLPLEAPEAAAVGSPQPDIAEVARSVLNTGRTISEWWRSQRQCNAEQLAKRGVLLDAQGNARPLVLADDSAPVGRSRHADREAAARQVAGLAASFRQAVLAVLPPSAERRDDRLRAPVLVVPLAGKPGVAMGSLLKQVKLALAAEGVPFEPNVTADDLYRLSDELRSLPWSNAMGPGGAIEQLLAAQGASSGESPCLLGFASEEGMSKLGTDAARVLFLHPRACVERTVEWVTAPRGVAEREAE